LNTIFRNSVTEVSTSSKLRAFLSHQSHHIKHTGTNFHTSIIVSCATCPHQLTNKSITRLGITHSTLNKLRMELHDFLATSQWVNKWSMDFPLFLHMQHHSTTTTLLFLKLLSVNIFPNAAVLTKNATREGAFTLHMLFHGKEDPFWLN